MTRETWDDFVRLFEARGGPHHCWCSPYRFRNAHEMSDADKQAALRALVEDDTPVGVLGYDGDQPVAWCSVAPRESYLRLERSRTMPRVTPAATPTWTVLCFFVAHSHRGQAVTRALLRGAVAYARARGAAVVEGYPFDSAGISSTHRGHSHIFQAARFRPQGRRWALGSTRG